MSLRRPHIKPRISLPMPFASFGLHLAQVVDATGELLLEDVLAVLRGSDSFVNHWGRFSPRFLHCENLKNVWVVTWIQSSGRPMGKVFDRQVYCMVWRDDSGIIQKRAVGHIQMRKFGGSPWDSLRAEPNHLVLTRPSPVRFVA